MTKKFNLKFPSMIAITLFGAAFTTQQAHAAETNQNSNNTNNVIDDQQNIKNAEQAKKEVTNSAQNVSGVQTYQNPENVKASVATASKTYDAKLDNLNTVDTSSQNQQGAQKQNTANTNTADSNSTSAKVQNNEQQASTLNKVDQKENTTQTQNNVNTNNQTSQASVNVSEVSEQQTNERTSANTNQEATQDVKNQNNTIDESSQQTARLTSSNKNNTNQSTVTPTQSNQAAQSKQQTEHKQTNTENISTYSDNATNATQSNVAQAKSSKVANSENTTTTKASTKATTKASTNATQTSATHNAQSGYSGFRSVGGKGGSATPVKTVKRYAARATTSSLPKYKPQVSSSINNYIRSNNLQAPKIEENYSSYFPKYGYRNGVGRPEGIVVHDTANDNSTIDGEINYMKNNYNSAFVHAFVDGNRIIETAPTDYLSWGAGPQANNRFINVEIVHTHDYVSFAKSMNNYADYAATQLQYYGLKPNSAENDGQGTVWTHYAISRFLGGTDHSDPHAYLQNHNYSYNELYDLINEKYLIKTGQVAPWGTTSSNSGSSNTNKGGSSNSGSTTTSPKLTVNANTGLAQIKTNNSGLYTTVYDAKGKATNQVHNTLSVTKSATLGKDKYYLVSDYNSGKVYGWVKQGETIYNTVKSPVKVNQSYNIKSGTTLYTVPWGNYNQVAGTVSKSNTAPFKATKSQQVGQSTYLFGSLNGKNGWVSKAFLTDITKPTSGSKTPAVDNTLKVSNLKNTLGQVSTKNKGSYTTVYDKNAKANATLGGKTYNITKKATLNNKDYYLISDYNGNTSRGWIPASEITVKSSTPTKTTATYYNIKGNANIYDTPWGTAKQVKATVPSSGKQLKSIDNLKVGNETYLHGVINNIWGWIKSTDVQQAPKVNAKIAMNTKATKPSTSSTQTVSKVAQVNANNSGAHATVYDKTGKNASKYANRTFNVSKEKTVNGNTYVLLQNTTQNTPLGWFNVKDLNIQNSSSVQKTSGTYKINNKNNGLYSIAWGTNQQRLDNKDLANQSFKVSKSVVVGNTSYLYGTVNGKTGWIAKDDLTSSNTSSNTGEKYQYEFIINNYNGFYYDDPTSVKATSLKAFNEQIFQVTNRKVINGKTWYYGKLSNGKYVWIKDTDLKKELVKYSKSYRTLNQAVSLQQNAYGAPPQVQRNGYGWSNATYSEIKNAMNPERLAKDETLKYQFLRLDRPQNISVASLNQLLKGKGVLENQGQAFSQAAATSGINEIYLVAHALIETGNGQSQLAKGANIVNNYVTTKSTTKYHNVFGIAAYDANPLYSGINYAKQAGWNSVSKAIIGGAKFIGKDYIKAGQNTLYKMRWNPDHPATHQYATDINWANINAQYLKQLYSEIKAVGKYFDITSYTK
ncbi:MULTISPECIES: GW dipeptide domain-containing protein [Staphylococcus]|uniref:GW dipeptide domain-containing protein n=1 Tax=Staphylococcus sp. HMSC34C02 TaxID=1608858 RepID=UPI0008A90B8C|nr:GW dipeptide domain-containing protein [Staphylococcus sp. HMSC34C02]OHR83083.1 mannosyl-glycoprotein endo-beta-N-acetylglucosamidase [Staphylococcus sp. HMSC34C02]